MVICRQRDSVEKPVSLEVYTIDVREKVDGGYVQCAGTDRTWHLCGSGYVYGWAQPPVWWKPWTWRRLTVQEAVQKCIEAAKRGDRELEALEAAQREALDAARVEAELERMF